MEIDNIDPKSAFNYEKRTFPLKVDKLAIENRAKNGQTLEVLTGRAVVFEEFTTLIDRWGDEFQEKFTKECMNETLADGHKIIALFNHSWVNLLGSTADNLTLDLREDGLHFELIPKSFEYDKRIIEFIKSGTIDGCSIGFRILESHWEEKDGQWFRIIEKIELYEITFTPLPAYEQTGVNVEVRKARVDVPVNALISDEERSKILTETDEILKQFEQ